MLSGIHDSSRTGGTGELSDLAGLAELHGLDDTSMIAMLQSRMGDVDVQIRTITQSLQNRTAEARRLGEQIQLLQAVRELLSNREYRNEDGTFNTSLELNAGHFRQFCERVGIDAPTAWAQAQDAGGDVNGQLSVGELLAGISINGTSLRDVTSPEALQLRSESLGDALRECNSENEQQMVKLQSAMQQRTQAVTMVTNMLKAADEARDAVVGNLR